MMSSSNSDEIHAIILGSTMFTVLLFQLLITFSVPVASSLYFLSTSQAGGVRFGLWGWCLQQDKTCLSPQLGYTWEPQISVPITSALIFFPIGTILTFFALLSLVPMLVGRTSAKAMRVFFAFVLSSFLASLLAFVFMIAMWSVARLRFHQAGFEAQFGPLPWLSLLATLILFVTTLVARHSISRVKKKSAVM